MVTCIIIDDNVLAIDTLKTLLNYYCSDVKVVGEAQTIKDAKDIILKNKPDVIFLDIEMNGENGFDLLAYFPIPDFKIVFTTSHEQYAISAIKVKCLDYLVKPINPDELVKCVENLFAREDSELNLISGNTEKNLSYKIAVVNSKEYFFLNLDEILYFKAEGQYTRITSIDSKKYLSSKNLGEIEKELPPYFFRTHKSWIINTKQILKFNKEDNLIFLSNSETAEISLRKRDEFLNLFNRI